MEYKLSPQGLNTTVYHMYTDNDIVNISTSETPKAVVNIQVGSHALTSPKKKKKFFLMV